MTGTQTDPDHPILREAWKHEVIGFRWHRIGDDPGVDLVLQHAETKVLKRLRFVGAREVVFSDTGMNWGLEILDVSARQLEGVRVHVHNFETSPGPVELYARDVAELLGDDE